MRKGVKYYIVILYNILILFYIKNHEFNNEEQTTGWCI